MAGVCNSMTGACTNPTKRDGTTCSDGNACTRTDTCQAGACVGASPVICTALDQCHVAGVCDTGTGICSNPARPDGSACSDADACTQIDSCQAGVCQGTTYTWSGLLSPINADGSSIFRLGSTVPVKFKLTGACDGRLNVNARLFVTKYSINILGTDLELLPKNKADVGNTFRSDSSGNYSFNLDTTPLSKGTWVLRVDLGDGVPDRTTLISLK
jgi:RNA polymerase subunit RPABC4/transcription elongation factor Spt4